MKVLLVGNYERDGQWSMGRFGDMLMRGLREEGIEVETVRPAVVLGGGGNKWLGYMDKFLLFRFAFRRALKERPGWVVHIIDQGNAIYAGWARGCLVTCHDLLAVRVARREFPAQRTRWSGRILQRWILRGLGRAEAIACKSRATLKDVERILGNGELIDLGLEDFWRPMDEKEALGRLQKASVCAGYVLHVGGDHWYKNRAGVVRAFIDLRKETAHEPKLVMVGPELGGSMLTELKEAGLDGEVTVLNGVSDEMLRALYSMAQVLVFPSIAEGFGWPIVEAQACGCPVVTTGREPMNETGGAGAIYANDGEWMKAVAQVLEMDSAKRVALIEKGKENARKYSARKMAREYIEFYKRHQQ